MLRFRYKDDILDVTGDEKELGKPIGSDAEENKNTYVKACRFGKVKGISKGIFGKSKEVT